MTVNTPRLLDFLHKLGLNSNPFEYTNADDEPLLEQYFVAPPYFDSVYGDPAHPASCMVLAPRGSGKSAQRKMVETQLPEDTILCVTYDTFRNPFGEKLTAMTLEGHVFNVSRITAVGLLTWMASHPESAKQLTGPDRDALRTVTLGLLSPANQAQLREALKSLRNLSDTAKSIWNDHHWVLDAIISSISILSGGVGGALPPASQMSAVEDDPEEAFSVLGRAAQAMGLGAIYVLVDKVDETQETQADPRSAYSMVAPLMHELRVLEHRPYAFKFFVPDYLQPFYQEDGGRSDRITKYETQWHNQELEEMMSRRLLAHSDGRLQRLEDLVETDPEASALVKLAILFAQSSPRDLIRIWGRAVDEQLRLDPGAGRISLAAVQAGIDTFCNDKAAELATASHLNDLRRVARIDFTVTEVASDVFHVVANSARAKIQAWEARGVVRQIGEIPMRRGRPHHHYGVTDVRVARSIFPDMALHEFVESKTRLCPACQSWMLRDWDDAPEVRDEACVECGVPVQPFG
jgi:hypothetical protein